MKPTLAAVQARLGIKPDAQSVPPHVHDWRIGSGLLPGTGKPGYHGQEDRGHVVYICHGCSDVKVEAVAHRFTARRKLCPACGDVT